MHVYDSKLDIEHKQYNKLINQYICFIQLSVEKCINTKFETKYGESIVKYGGDATKWPQRVSVAGKGKSGQRGVFTTSSLFCPDLLRLSISFSISLRFNRSSLFFFGWSSIPASFSLFSLFLSLIPPPIDSGGQPSP